MLRGCCIAVLLALTTLSTSRALSVSSTQATSVPGFGVEAILSKSIYRNSDAWASVPRWEKQLERAKNSAGLRREWQRVHLAKADKGGKKGAHKLTTAEKLQALPPHQKASILLVAGGIAGAVAKSCVAPLERVKLLAQAGECKQGLWGVMVEVVQKEGVLGLWRGNTVNVLRMIPNKGVLHMTNDMYKDLIKHCMTTVPMMAGISHGTQHFMTGSLAGMTSVIATYPLDLIRTRMAGRLCVSDACLPYNTWWETARWTVENEGVAGLYRGVSPTLIGALPYEGIKFWSYDYFKSVLPKNEDGTQHVGWKLFAGSAAATVAHLATYPMDTVRRRMQLQGAGGAKVLYKNAMDCAIKLGKEEGPKALYRGLTATLIRGIPNTGIQFGVYEFLKTLLKIV